MYIYICVYIYILYIYIYIIYIYIYHHYAMPGKSWPYDSPVSVFVHTYGELETRGDSDLNQQVEIDEMVVETSQRFFPSFSAAFG